ncbi:MAG TPA: hypothetical protein VMS02_09460, partial [Solirubrobacteraceae bacterium]|nr:hypothetical protein [Solirubrobacteraceae bacterium]
MIHSSRIRRPAVALATLGALTLACASGAPARGAGWRSAPALAPPPPPGVAAAPYPVPLGHVSEISFWAPNRGLLVTGGDEAEGGPVPAGVYAYDGVSWHELASVCGGAEGRIAWAGPDEFWTIAEQRAGQLVSHEQNSEELQSISLCHFLDGQVVGSYAMPLEQPDSYRKMDAAACYGPSDCWFGGTDGTPPDFGAFHLHWNGSAVEVVYEPEDHAVTSMANFAGTLYESVQLGAGDTWLPEESKLHPAVIHKISPTAATFQDVTIFDGEDLPRYGEGVQPDALQGLDLATDGGPLGAGATQLWAAANPVKRAPAPSGSAAVTILRDAGGQWSQLTPGPNGESLLANGAQLAGTADAIAPEPASAAAWLSLHGERGEPAEVSLVEALDPANPATEPHARVLETRKLPEKDEPIGPRGEAGPVACPAPHDCWLATVGEAEPMAGWLFHLDGGAPVAPNTDPFFDGADGVISYRPPDSGVPTIYPDAPPEDDSLANQQQAPPAPIGPPEQAPAGSSAPRAKARPLLEHVKSELLRHRLLVISFTLTARAHVRLVARRHAQVVAHTPRESLGVGRHRLALALDPGRWPTGLKFEATPLSQNGSNTGGS